MINERERQELNALRCEAPDVADESEHFRVCEHCGQTYDMRRLGDAFHHMEPEHDPIPPDA